MTIELKWSYNTKYAEPNYFRYREWLYRPYIAALVSYCRLAPGSTVLDVGCGQGLFAHLLAQNGMRVRGIDISEAGIGRARQLYGSGRVDFEVANIETAQFTVPFDCIFVRSCSLYNTDDFLFSDAVTEKLLAHLKPGGTFMFLYNSSFSEPEDDSWRHHSLADVRRHFQDYPDRQCFFSSKIDTWLFGRYAFNSFCTRANTLISRIFGSGGDLICIFRKPELE